MSNSKGDSPVWNVTIVLLSIAIGFALAPLFPHKFRHFGLLLIVWPPALLVTWLTLRSSKRSRIGRAEDLEATRTSPDDRLQTTERDRAKNTYISVVYAWLLLPAASVFGLGILITDTYNPVRDDYLPPERLNEWIGIRIAEVVLGLVVTALVLVHHSREVIDARAIRRVIIAGWILQLVIPVVVIVGTRLG